MFKIEKTRPLEENEWQLADREQAIAKARAALVAPGDMVTVKNSTTGETVWMAIIGRDSAFHEWNGSAPQEIHVAPALAGAA